MEAVEGGAAGRQRVNVWRADVGPEGPEMSESGVIEDDDHDVRSPLRRLGVRRDTRHRLGRREADLLGFIHGPRG